MEQKRVSFKVANALKEAGYPQGNTTKCYLTSDHNQFYKEGQIVENDDGEWSILTKCLADIPTYIEAWLWLCDHLNYINKRKLQSIRIFRGKNKWEVKFNCGCLLDSDDDDGCYYEFMGNTQEEVIINAIDYLVDNNLIK